LVAAKRESFAFAANQAKNKRVISETITAVMVEVVVVQDNYAHRCALQKR
jgi:hypothetical protein